MRFPSYRRLLMHSNTLTTTALCMELEAWERLIVSEQLVGFDPRRLPGPAATRRLFDDVYALAILTYGSWIGRALV